MLNKQPNRFKRQHTRIFLSESRSKVAEWRSRQRDEQEIVKRNKMHNNIHNGGVNGMKIKKGEHTMLQTKVRTREKWERPRQLINCKLVAQHKMVVSLRWNKSLKLAIKCKEEYKNRLKTNHFMLLSQAKRRNPTRNDELVAMMVLAVVGETSGEGVAKKILISSF